MTELTKPRGGRHPWQVLRKKTFSEAQIVAQDQRIAEGLIAMLKRPGELTVEPTGLRRLELTIDYTVLEGRWVCATIREFPKISTEGMYLEQETRIIKLAALRNVVLQIEEGKLDAQTFGGITFTVGSMFAKQEQQNGSDE